MKAYERILMLLFSLLCLCACKDSSYSRFLGTADSLVNVNPDSAIVLLRNVKNDMASASKAERMYYHLLCVKADDKAYITHTSDSLMAEVLHYYIDKGDKRHLPEAYYYAGRVCRDLGDAPQALEYFGKAMEMMPKDEKSDLKSRVYSQMGTLFLFQNIHDEALKIFKEAYQYDSLRKDTAGMIYNLRDMATVYRATDVIDSSFYCYQKSYDLACSLRDSSFIKLVQCQMAGLYIQLGKYDAAKRNLFPSLTNHHIASRSGIYVMASKLYRQMGENDSAVYYYKELLKYGTIYAKTEAYRGLAEVATERGNSDKALDYLKMYMLYNDSVSALTDREAVRKMNSFYNYQLREKENYLLHEKNDTKMWIIAGLLAALFIIVSGGIYGFRKYRQRKELMLKAQCAEIERWKEEESKKEKEIEEGRRKEQRLKEALCNAESAKEELEEQLKEVQEQLRNLKAVTEKAKSEREKKRNIFRQKDIAVYIDKQKNSKTYKMTDKNWNELEVTLNEVYPDFVQKLKLFPMNENDFRMSMLIKAGISPGDIAQFVHCTSANISMARKRLFAKYLKGIENLKGWDDFISSL